MKFHSPSLFLFLILFSIGVAVPSYAKAKHERAHPAREKLESYSAVEEEGIDSETDAFNSPATELPKTEAQTVHSLRETAKGTSSGKSLEERIALIEKKLDRPGAAPQFQLGTQSGVKSENYDQVPSEKTEMIVKRLRLVEEILKKSGRAYDYRKFTTPQLEAMLKGVSKTSERDFANSI